MQVTQTLSEGLKQEFKVVLPAGELAAKLAAQLSRDAGQSPDQGIPPRQGADLAISRSSMARA